jgi:hypothetical protein
MPFDRRRAGVILVIPLLLAACRHRDRDRDGSSVAGANAKFEARDTARVLHAGDVQIASTDSAVELAIFGDTIVAGLGKKVLDKVRGETDTASVTGTGLAASIEKSVKSSVASALSHQLLFPLADVSDVKDEGGRLVFYAKNGSKMHLFESSSRGKENNQTFSEADAQRFIAAFKARKASTG